MYHRIGGAGIIVGSPLRWGERVTSVGRYGLGGSLRGTDRDFFINFTGVECVIWRALVRAWAVVIGLEVRM